MKTAHFCTVSTFWSLVKLYSYCLPQHRFIQRCNLITLRIIKCHQQLFLYHWHRQVSQFHHLLKWFIPALVRSLLLLFVQFTRLKHRLRIFYTYICIKVDNNDYCVKIKCVNFRVRAWYCKGSTLTVLMRLGQEAWMGETRYFLRNANSGNNFALILKTKMLN